MSLLKASRTLATGCPTSVLPPWLRVVSQITEENVIYCNIPVILSLVGGIATADPLEACVTVAVKV